MALKNFIFYFEFRGEMKIWKQTDNYWKFDQNQKRNITTSTWRLIEHGVMKHAI